MISMEIFPFLFIPNALKRWIRGEFLILFWELFAFVSREKSWDLRRLLQTDWDRSVQVSLSVLFLLSNAWFSLYEGNYNNALSSHSRTLKKMLESNRKIAEAGGKIGRITFMKFALIWFSAIGSVFDSLRREKKQQIELYLVNVTRCCEL